jgi:hypothetical protein
MTKSQQISWLFERRSKYAALNSIVCLCCLTLVTRIVPLPSQDRGGGAIAVKVVPKDYNGPCPVVVQFQATLFDGMAHKVRFYWEHGGGKSTPQRSGEIRDGKLDVSDEFSVGVPGHTFVATDRLHVLFDGYKEELVSQKIETQGTCVK